MDEEYLFNDNEIAEEETTELENIEEKTDEEVETETDADNDTDVEVEAEPIVEKDTTVPLTALQQERERHKASKSQIDALNAQIAQLKAKEIKRPDPYDDPDAYSTFVNEQIAAQVEQRMTQQRFIDARERAIEEHGEQFVHDLADWVDQYEATVDPNIGNKVLAARDPLKFITDLKKRHEALQAFETDETSFIKQRALELGLIQTVEKTVETKPTAKKPDGPRSIVNVSNRDNREDNSDDFDAIFQ